LAAALCWLILRFITVPIHSQVNHVVIWVASIKETAIKHTFGKIAI
jgi:hypothetical protein